jgi:hypothetical protein
VKPKCLGSSATYRSFALQNHIQQSATYAMAVCKGDLTSLDFDCCSQQTNDVIIVKYKRVFAQAAREDNGASLVIDLGRHGLSPTADA